jgi:acyl-ACP thioesterase
MAYFSRALYNILWGLFHPKISLTKNQYLWSSRVGITDIDMFLHMNHSQYLSV